jgi:uncharacterized protein (TIGR03083 family)
VTRSAYDETPDRSALDGELDDLAAYFEELESNQWDHLSLCEGWRVREVVAHMTMPARMSTTRLIFALAKDRGNFNRTSNRVAHRDACLPSAELVTPLRSDTMRKWTPPGDGVKGALVHAVIHGLDVTIPLGDIRRVPLERMSIVLPLVARPKSVKYFGVNLDGVKLQANDLDWSMGNGPVVCGAAQDLAMLLSGRKISAGQLSGEGSMRFTNE